VRLPNGYGPRWLFWMPFSVVVQKIRTDHDLDCSFIHALPPFLHIDLGMVGYPESLTDPSYRGQILVLTFPLIGNYGVPSRETMDPLLKDLPKYFESNEIHIAGLIVGQYSQDLSHYLAASSLGAWLKEYNIPAIYGIDTRAMTKKIRSKGVMLGKILFPTSLVGPSVIPADAEWMTNYQNVDWVDPNARNLVAEGI